MVTKSESISANLGRTLALRLFAAAMVLGAMFFLPAGTLHYWEAWVYLGTTLVPIGSFSVYLLKKNPALLERRLKAREKEPAQKRIMALSLVVLLAAFLTPGFDKRFDLSEVPAWLVVASDGAVLVGYCLFVLILKENEYASRTVAVEEGQHVVTTGPYSLIRHPMYFAATLIYLASPLALGSFWALIPASLFPFFLAARIYNEESVLLRDLEGYADYCKEVRYRLIPGVW